MEDFMFRFLTLDIDGLLLATGMGLLLLTFGGAQAGFFLVTIVWFLLLSALVTDIGKSKKIKIGMYEPARGWRNVLANGIIPLLIVIIYAMVGNPFLAVAYAASVASVTADKFSSEIGMLNGKPIMLIGLQRVKQGTSGGVSVLGLVAGIVASVLIGLALVLMQNFVFYLFVVVFSAFIGNLVDSFLGFFERKGVGSKYTSNALCALTGGAVCFLILTLFA